jgi:hypothetical protein
LAWIGLLVGVFKPKRARFQVFLDGLARDSPPLQALCHRARGIRPRKWIYYKIVRFGQKV